MSADVGRGVDEASEGRAASNDRLRRSEDRYLAQSDDAVAQWFDAKRQWSARLAIANGAGLVGVSGVLLKSGELFPLNQALVVSAWLFFIGVGFAGVVPLIRTRYHLHRHIWLLLLSQEQSSGGRALPLYVGTRHQTYTTSAQQIAKNQFRTRLWDLVVATAEAVSSVAFLAGIAYPLWIVTERAFR